MVFVHFWAIVENQHHFLTPQLRRQSYYTSYYIKILPERLLELFIIYCDTDAP